MPGKPKHLGVPNGRMVLAVSDGELSSTAGPQGQGEGRGSSLSIHSLPSGPSSPFPTEEQPVASWGLSFERLLQDPLGLAYFTEFLKKEFSAENVTFWKACERFQQIPASDTKQLAQEARNIYQEFLSSQALSPVNIDRQAWLGEEVLAEPRPDMFREQQLQASRPGDAGWVEGAWPWKGARWRRGGARSGAWGGVEKRPNSDPGAELNATAGRKSEDRSRSGGGGDREGPSCGRGGAKSRGGAWILAVGSRSWGLAPWVGDPANPEGRAWNSGSTQSARLRLTALAPAQQIFNLMKFDSYARFVKSPLYRECLLAEAEGRPLQEPGSSRLGSPDTTRKKPKLKPGKSLPLGVEEVGQLPPAEGPGGRPLRKSFRKELAGGVANSGLRRESQGSLNSSASLDLGFLAFVSSKSESHRKSLGSSEGESESRPGKYCCVYLPDGTASLALARPGLTIRAMLAGICEKRGLSLPDIKVYLVGNEQKALVLDQDCTVLADQEVRLENRITFELELAALERVVRISAKPTKRLQEALQPVLAKHGLSLQQVALHRPGEKQPLDLEKLVSSVAAQRVVLDTLPGVKISEAGDKSPCRSQGRPPKTQDKAAHPTPLSLNSLAETPSNVTGKRQTCDIEGLVELLNRVQSSGAHDQRGLLRKEDLVLPEFLQLPAQRLNPQEAPPQTESAAQPKEGPSDSTAHSAL
uniref:Regulator of G-protein signaling 14 n=2 Tax=Equus caballus TaxID=9796 RepID=A0A9L0SNK7_HORSE